MALLVENHYHRLVNNDTVQEGRPKRDGIDEELECLILQSQSRRLNDQRTPLPPDPQQRLFLDLLLTLQSSRMDDQRASLNLETKETAKLTSHSPAPHQMEEEIVEDVERPLSEEEFIDLLFRSQVSRGGKNGHIHVHFGGKISGWQFFNSDGERERERGRESD